MSQCLVLLAFAIPVTLFAQQENASKLYAQYCASCHGEKMEAFTDRKWKNGNNATAISYSIANGFADKGMPAFGQVLNKEQLESLAQYILKGIAQVDQFQKAADIPANGIYTSNEHRLQLQPYLSEINIPWGMAMLPDGQALITDKTGPLYLCTPTGQKQIVTGTPMVLADGQGGLMDILLHPDFAKNSMVYLSYSLYRQNQGKVQSTSAVMRARLNGTQLKDTQTIFIASPWSERRHHYGCRMVFDKKGFLYITVGDRGDQSSNPQSLSSHCGKVHRLNEDGTIPNDNPFVHRSTAIPSIYTYGHRNPQGIAVHPETGELWVNEHGPRGGDELNKLIPARNYGWPVISYGINYDGTVFTNLTAKEGMEQPVVYWIPSIAPSSLIFVKGDKYPGWKNHALTSSLRFNYLHRNQLQGDKSEKEFLELKPSGRMRFVYEAPDGFLYIGLEQPGRVYKVIPLD